LKDIVFEQRTEIRDSSILEERFGCLEVDLEEAAVVVFVGSASLARGVHFRGFCEIGDQVSIDTGCVLDNVSIGTGTKIRSHSILNNCRFGENNIIGPYCFVRDHTRVGDSCIVGSHVEIARSKLGNDVKISHQAFVGDATLDHEVVIGAGVVFCNFDGNEKQSSVVGMGTLVGSGTLIVSPVVVGAKVIVGAGSVVNKNIGDNERFVQIRTRKIGG